MDIYYQLEFTPETHDWYIQNNYIDNNTMIS